MTYCLCCALARSGGETSLNHTPYGHIDRPLDLLHSAIELAHAHLCRTASADTAYKQINSNNQSSTRHLVITKRVITNVCPRNQSRLALFLFLSLYQ